MLIECVIVICIHFYRYVDCMLPNLKIEDCCDKPTVGATSRSRTELAPTINTRQTALLMVELSSPKCIILS